MASSFSRWTVAFVRYAFLPVVLEVLGLLSFLSSGVTNPIGRLGGSCGLVSPRTASSSWRNCSRVLRLNVSWQSSKLFVLISSSASQLVDLMVAGGVNSPTATRKPATHSRDCNGAKTAPTNVEWRSHLNTNGAVWKKTHADQ